MVPFGNYGWSFGFGFGWILIGINIILMAFGIAHILKLSRQTTRGQPQEETALDILKKRYARSEIGKEAFEEKRKHIEV